MSRAIEEAPADISLARPRLRCVKARQKIRASGLELWHELFRKLKLDFRLTSLAESAEKSGETKRRSVLNHCRLRRVAELFGFCKRVLDLTEPLNELVVQRSFPRKNAPLRDLIAQHFCSQTAL